jgi:hypothetical protein
MLDIIEVLAIIFKIAKAGSPFFQNHYYYRFWNKHVQNGNYF